MSRIGTTRSSVREVVAETIGMAVANAADFVREHAHGVTRARGGEGAAREFCELILRAQGRLDAANAAYLKNPAPEYPSLAQRRGWEGTVLLRVQVLASGKPGEIQVQKSSGRQQLDDAALAAVKRWSFVPAKQGDVAQNGWVSMPIDFKIH